MKVTTISTDLAKEVFQIHCIDITISKRETDLLLYQMLRESGISIIVAKIYHLAVICFGANDIKNKDYEPPNRELTIEPLPNTDVV